LDLNMFSLNIHMSKCHSRKDQQWEFDSSTGQLLSRHSKGKTKCVDATSSWTMNALRRRRNVEHNVFLYDCHDGINQKWHWYVPPVPNVTVASPDFFLIGSNLWGTMWQHQYECVNAGEGFEVLGAVYNKAACMSKCAAYALNASTANCCQYAGYANSTARCVIFHQSGSRAWSDDRSSQTWAMDLMRSNGSTADWHLAPAGATVCDTGTNAAENQCEDAVAEIAAARGSTPQRSLQIGSGGSCGDGAWGLVPVGCSAQSGGDWSAHYKTSGVNDCPHAHYQLVCGEASADASTEAACQQCVEQFDANGGCVVAQNGQDIKQYIPVGCDQCDAQMILHCNANAASKSSTADSMIVAPTASPTLMPTNHPTGHPTPHPTRHPHTKPTDHPTGHPTRHPTRHPHTKPTTAPTQAPTHETRRRGRRRSRRRRLTSAPTALPPGHSHAPTRSPTPLPPGHTHSPTQTHHPTALPPGHTHSPTRSPTPLPPGHTHLPTPLPPVYTHSSIAGAPTSLPPAHTHAPTRSPTPLPPAHTHSPTRSPTPLPPAHTHSPTRSPTPSPPGHTHVPTPLPPDHTHVPTRAPTFGKASTGNADYIKKWRHDKEAHPYLAYYNYYYPCVDNSTLMAVEEHNSSMPTLISNVNTSLSKNGRSTSANSSEYFNGTMKLSR
jgi:hypothetical protein